jgi:hypothetical protein
MEKSKTLLEILDLSKEPNTLADIIDNLEKKEKKVKAIRSDSRVKLEIEIENEFNDFRVVHSSYYSNFNRAKNTIPTLKKKYALHNKSYRFFITIRRKEKREV